jgi:hypothetical protein
MPQEDDRTKKLESEIVRRKARVDNQDEILKEMRKLLAAYFKTIEAHTSALAAVHDFLKPPAPTSLN